jgi:hypothetical protein
MYSKNTHVIFADSDMVVDVYDDSRDVSSQVGRYDLQVAASWREILAFWEQ